MPRGGKNRKKPAGDGEDADTAAGKAKAEPMETGILQPRQRHKGDERGSLCRTDKPPGALRCTLHISITPQSGSTSALPRCLCHLGISCVSHSK